MLAVILVALLVSIGLPSIYSWRVLRLDEPSLAAWLLVVVDAALVLALMLLVARWDIAGFYTRLGAIGVFGIALLWSLARHFRRPWHVPGTSRPRWTIAVSLVLRELTFTATVAKDWFLQRRTGLTRRVCAVANSYQEPCRG